MINKKIHMIGIGGIGMSGLAFILHDMGSKISGSDVESNGIIKSLRDKSIDVKIGHDQSNVKDSDYVVYSSSIRQDNPELEIARRNKIPILSRIELLKKVCQENKQVIAVAGTHGKTTITAITSFLLDKAGLSPTVLIGGESLNFGTNAKLGKNEILVTEMDESDGRFVILEPTHVIMPNLEKEHLEHYKDEEDLIKRFKDFLKKQSSDNVFFYRWEDKVLQELAKCHKGRNISFGFRKEADIYADNINIGTFRIDFDCYYDKNKLGRFTINLPGIHNVLNALAAISLGINLSIDTKVMIDAIKEFRGVKRRFEVMGNVRGAKVVEDYAHHPTEIKATILAAKSLKPKRLITIFQPHRYSRTKSFYREFAESFDGSDEVVLTDVYSASEDKIEGADTESIYNLMKEKNVMPVTLVKKEDVPGYITSNADKGDIVLVLGAGDIGKIAQSIFK